MRQAGLIPKKCPFKGDSLKSSTVPETDNTSHQDINTTSQAEQRGAATGSRDTAGVEDMEIGVVEEVTTTLLGRHGRKRSSSGRWIRNTQSHASESIAVSTETDLTGTSLSMPAQSGSESGAQSHSGSEPGLSSQQGASASATVPVTLRASAMPPLYTLAPTTTSVTPSTAHHDTMYERAMAYLRNFESVPQASGSVSPAPGMSVSVSDFGSKEASTAESPITAAVQALLDIHNVPLQPPATRTPSFPSETNLPSGHCNTAESLDAGTSGGAEPPGSVVPSQQPLCSATEEILRDSASGIEVVDSWSGRLAISPLVVQENGLRPRESSTTSSQNTATPVASQAHMMPTSWTSSSPFPPRMILSIPAGYNVSSGTPSATVGSSSFPPYVPFVESRLLPPSAPQATLMPITETSVVETEPRPLVVKEAEFFLSELNEIFLVLMENPAYKSHAKRRHKSRVAVVEDDCAENVRSDAVSTPLCSESRVVTDGGSSETSLARESEENIDKPESENIEVSMLHNVSEPDDGDIGKSPPPEEPSVAKRPRLESSGVGSALTTESMTAADLQETGVEADSQQATPDPPQEKDHSQARSSTRS